MNTVHAIAYPKDADHVISEEELAACAAPHDMQDDAT